MKKIYLFVCVVVGIFTITNATAQTNVTSSGISIQGIARDINNEALTNIDQLDLKFEVYYLVGTSTTPTIISTTLATVKTDNFGVFSYVVSLNQDQSNLISTQSAYLRVSSLGVVFSDEKLQTVPYAIYAQNGVPTGSIMPYIGTTAPNGWLLCDGSAIPSGIYYDKLKTLVGNNTPDLRAMFLRGAGSGNGEVGPDLKVVQQDALGTHNHGVNINTNYAGSHDHSAGAGGYFEVLKQDNNSTANSTDYSNGEPNLYSSRPIKADGNHYHNVSGNTYTTGGSETRPINYGVNYIIKI